jgi:hypothetical protein
MDMHQIFNIADQKLQCPYCHKDLNNASWHSHFESIKMYKAFHCECGRFLSLPVDFFGSGHDNWDKKESWKSYRGIKISKTKNKIRTLESRLKIVKEYKLHP